MNFTSLVLYIVSKHYVLQSQTFPRYHIHRKRFRFLLTLQHFFHLGYNPLRLHRCKIGGIDLQPLSRTFKGIHAPLHKFLVEFIPGHGIVQAVPRARGVVLLQHVTQMTGMGIISLRVTLMQNIQISPQKHAGAFGGVLL